MNKPYIDLKGVRVHNLKNIDLKIELNKLIVITGVSGSGKSSLAFDTLYAEGQRRYVESLSSYARKLYFCRLLRIIRQHFMLHSRQAIRFMPLPYFMITCTDVL